MTTHHKIISTSTAELKSMLDDSSELIEEIREEIAQREAQERELEPFDTLIEEARPKMDEIRNFFTLVLSELRHRPR
ncbi:hypothetical protein [Vreelandella populi]|uniref:Uncharacterized protein n=1 Tax=Vreelandella populi TaxID=2498858 RepID=A0A3S0WLU3_9GAMM|nr:hypothetical protein [Halomonas populi]RUR40908.1 hypothetical protein ELY25_04395 [Halomonas populi]RUR49419.1 hypothetical protein ELY37_01595 [Halomonas populi]RUR55903.1 hypothetical protein ELY40_05440 [Halomonas populi]